MVSHPDLTAKCFELLTVEINAIIGDKDLGPFVSAYKEIIWVAVMLFNDLAFTHLVK